MTLDFVVKGRCVDIYYCVNIYYSFLLSIVHLLITRLARVLLLREDVSIFILCTCKCSLWYLIYSMHITANYHA